MTLSTPTTPRAPGEHLPPSRRSVAFWRRWHRWIGFPAAVFLLWSALTGVVVAGTEFFGEDEALREQLRTVTSPVSTASAAAEWTASVGRALATVAAQSPDAPVDKVIVQFKGPAPTVAVFTGKRGGGEDRQFVVNARTGALVSVEDYADKPFLYRLHSGEAFGDGGLVVAMGWGLALAVLSLTGIVIWWRIRRRGATGIRRLFWH
ncbi:hypothetical protein J421_6299 (plasmid) [Gemmatirosa kalamazoonensis]|uniref:PepSY-associated TM helix domain protein n=1 Tax=Gemmatirosa kalamazoonensis TaxID=861299 RepID=W0RS81_9BACT|nr:PepSY-associated TM helix domain-containing protein [Gemmatirosa kalamazoonensis]AHG93834.1 hypothetical protein J421_6299 [Gemmatirosa kalamazoonensis]